MEGVIKGFENLHMPLLPTAAWAYMAACGEFFGGISVLLGLLARLGAIPIIITMLVAIAKVHGPNGFSLPQGCEYNVNLIAMSAAVLIAGPGLISLDALIFRRGLWARGPQPLSP
jgi:putative oxidoreductase